MKKMFRFLTLAVMSVILGPVMAVAQEGMGQIKVYELDPQVRHGVLPNGLTYYIRHNEYPKGQADFYIAQKVGSALENEDQRGLAHFLEHMCFNGTKHFPGNSLVDWLGSVGVRFGENLNAYTGVDETVYNISNVPVARTGVQDSCLLILHDWANDLLLDPEEIDKERGVIEQEWRRSNVGQQRIVEAVLPLMYPDSPYGRRLPIGTMDVVLNFAPQTLRDYYEKWYRPDQQGIVVVGDIDVDRIEGKIKEIFADIEMPENAAERVYHPVGDHKGTIYAIGHDPEQKTNLTQMMFLTDPLPTEYNNTIVKLQMDYMMQMVCDMLNSRLNDIASAPNSPFAYAGCDYGDYFLAKTKEAFTLVSLANGNDVLGAMEAVYREALRAARGGFSQSEYDRARNEYLSRLERIYNNRETRQSESYVKEYVRHFIDNEATPGIEVEYNDMKLIAENVPVEALNQILPQLITNDNRVVLSLNTDNPEGVYPTEEQFTEVFNKVDAETIETFVDNVKTDPLIANMPKAGKIKSTRELPQWGATEWTLSNGAKVIWKHTDFKKDEIQMMAIANGGTSVLPAKYDNTLRFLDAALNSYGLGSYNNKDLTKYLQGKQANLNFSFDDYTRDIAGSTTTRDLPVLMEMLYMAMTDMTFDADEFAALQSTYSGILANQAVSPEYQWQVAIQKALYESPRKAAIDVDAVNAASASLSKEIVSAMTSNAADYTFIFVGNVDGETLRPLVEQYIASLPGNAKKATTTPVFNAALDPRGGEGLDVTTMEMQTPQSYVFILDQANLPYNIKNQKIASFAGQILTKRLIKTIREEMGAVYSIGAGAFQMRVADKNNVLLQSQFPMKPDMQDAVLAEIRKIMLEMAGNVTEDEVKDIKEYMVKSAVEGKEQNGNWLGAIGGWTRNGVDTFNGDVDAINSITPADVQQFMNTMSNSGNYRVIVLAPAETKADAEAAK